MNRITFHEVGIQHGLQPVLNSVSFECQSGELVGLLGVNGSGKTSLLNVLSGWSHLSQGSIQWNGDDWSQVPAKEKMRRVSFCPQTYAIPESATVEETLLMGASEFATHWFSLSAPRLSQKEKQRLDGWADLFGVTHLKSQSFASLSGGEQRRVLLARTFARQTDLVLLDEPLANLDLKGQIDVALLLRSIVQKKSSMVIWSLHDWNLAMEFCDRVIVLHQGTSVYNGVPSGVVNETEISKSLGKQWQWVENPNTQSPMLAFRGPGKLL